MSILKVENLSKHFIGLVAVDKVSFEVEQGEIFGIIGPNGAGKTTIFNMIAGAIPKTDGKITFYNNRIDNFLNSEVARKGIARTFQNTKLFNNMTVAENIFVGGLYNFKSGIYNGIFGLLKARKEKDKLEDDVIEMLEFFNLVPYADRMADNLSYGHQRSLEIARAVISKPKLLLLDEPSAGMNSTETTELMSLIKTLQNQGITVIVIEHDMKFIKGICNRIMVINYGIKIAEGTADEVLMHPKVLEAYLGSEQDYE